MEVVEAPKSEFFTEQEEAEISDSLAATLWPWMQKDLFGTVVIVLWVASSLLNYAGIDSKDGVALFEHFMDGKDLPERLIPEAPIKS